MKRNPVIVCMLATLLLAVGQLRSQETAFTYQGRLDENGVPANGIFDLEFRIFDMANGGMQKGAVVTANDVLVTNGLFGVLVDPGPGVFDGNMRWLQLGVRPGPSTGDYTHLAPRQLLSASPYAIYAHRANASGITGIVPASNVAGTYSNAVVFNNAGNSFAGNGAGLTNVNALQLGGLSASNFWQMSGNMTMAGQFLGTINNEPVELRVNNARGLRLEPTTNATMVNVIAGSGGNFVAPSVVGATIAGGGTLNYIFGVGSNSIAGNFGAIGGGYRNEILTNAEGATITGGVGNTIGPHAFYSVINGGSGNGIHFSSPGATIGGGTANQIQAGGFYSTIGGGVRNRIVSTSGATIAGGTDNFVGFDAARSTISGGHTNRIEDLSEFATVGGGLDNSIQADASYSTIGGGDSNVIMTNTRSVTIGGGVENTVKSHAWYATIAGGDSNTIETNSVDATIGGGSFNTVLSNAVAATIPGGSGNIAAGSYSFAAGRLARALHEGAFVWADTSQETFNSTAPKQFLIRASGGVGIGASNVAGALSIRGPVGSPPSGMAPLDNALVLGSFDTNGYKWIQSYGGPLVLNLAGNNVGIGKTDPASALDVNGTVTAMAFNPTSDRHLKQNFAMISPVEVLDKVASLPITRWNFKGDTNTCHLGPMAQDFYAAFGLGTDDRHIATVDADGVALAAIQGLNQKLEEHKAELNAKNSRISELEQRLSTLEVLLRALTRKGN